MKILRTLLTSIVVLLNNVSVSAYDFEVDGIYYNITSAKDLTVEVTRNGTYMNKEYVIPSSVVFERKAYIVSSIGSDAFKHSYNLKKITIPTTIIGIGESAFEGCENLKSVVIPKSVTSIGRFAFLGCRKLASITIPDHVSIIEERTFSGCLNLKSVTIPNSVTRIEIYAFSGCVNLKSLTLGENIGIIRLFAFDECRVLEEITCYAKKPPLSDGMILLSKNRAKCKLRVPKGSLLTYKTAPVWKLFKKIEGF